MKKYVKITGIILAILITILLIDTLQAKLFNNKPILKITKNYNGGSLYQVNKGVLVNTYICADGTKKSVFKWEKYTCPMKVDDSLNIDNENESESNTDMIKSINVIINNKNYIANIENNNTAQSFAKRLPQSFNMKELNGNEKYFYMKESLPTNTYNPKHIEAGDIMLYNDDCLVIFYQSFETNYSYTKIGHINNLPDLGNDDINVKFEL